MYVPGPAADADTVDTIEGALIAEMTDLRSAPAPSVAAEDHVDGPPDLPLVVLYGDFSCPRCALAHERLRAAPLRRGFRHFALSTRHPRAVALACAAEAAGRQESFWAMHDLLFADPGRLDDPHLWQRVQRLGLDLERFESDRRDPEVLARVRRDTRGGLRAGVGVTPTLLADGRLHPGVPDASLLGELADGSARP